jgi:Na+/H+ antiporter NhaD/arsenite permease-like protein
MKEKWSFFPIGRTGGSILMGVVTVAAKTLGPEEAFDAIEYGTLALLWGMMILVEYLKDDALFDSLMDRFFIKNDSLTPTKLLWLVSMFCGSFSALFTNDTMCIALTKVICHVCTQRGYHPGPQMVAIAMSANIGSAATLIGNPQNAIIASLSDVSFAKFFLFSALAATVCLVINTFALQLWFADDLRTDTEFARIATEKNAGKAGVHEGDSSTLIVKSVDTDVVTLEELPTLDDNSVCCLGPFKRETLQVFFRNMLVVVILLTLGAFLADLDIGWTAAGGGVAAMALDATVNHKSPERILARVNWELLIFFSGLFIVIAGLQETELPGESLDLIEDQLQIDNPAGVMFFTLVVTIGCNIFNNVPFVLLMGLACGDPFFDPAGLEDCPLSLTSPTDTCSACTPAMADLGDEELAWIYLAWVATVAGNLTLMGSVANLIVAEEGKVHTCFYGTSFFLVTSFV